MNKIYISVTVDWEGEHFNNLRDLVKVRNVLTADIPVTHFICPSYFTNKLPKGEQKIREAVFENDEIALHIHCYRSLINAVGNIPFRSEPNYYRTIPNFANRLPKIVKQLLFSVSGRGVPLSAYTFDEIYRIINYSKQLLQEQLNCSEIQSFRAGGWLASSNVLSAIKQAGIINDSSAVPPEILSQDYNNKQSGTLTDDYGDNNGVFTDFNLKMWGYEQQNEGFLENKLAHDAIGKTAVNRLSQPYFIDGVLEMPNNCALTDFASIEKTMRPVLEHGIQQIESGRQSNFFMNIGCHHEGSFEFKIPLIDFIKSLTPKELEFIQFVSVGEAAEIFRKNRM